MTPTQGQIEEILQRADEWDRCYPGNVDIGSLIDDLADALEALAAERVNRKGICLTGPDGEAYIAPFDIGAEARAKSWKGVAEYLRDVLVVVADQENEAVKKVLATYEAQLAVDPASIKEGRGKDE